MPGRVARRETFGSTANRPSRVELAFLWLAATVLTFAAGVAILFTGRCYRVLAYVALMRDEYPPFRLDSGGTDPGHVVAPAPAPMPAPVGSSH